MRFERQVKVVKTFSNFPFFFCCCCCMFHGWKKMKKSDKQNFYSGIRFETMSVLAIEKNEFHARFHVTLMAKKEIVVKRKKKVPATLNPMIRVRCILFSFFFFFLWQNAQFIPFNLVCVLFLFFTSFTFPSYIFYLNKKNLVATMIHLRLRGKIGTSLLFVFWVSDIHENTIITLHIRLLFVKLPPALEILVTRSLILTLVVVVVIIKYWSVENLSASKILASLKDDVENTATTKTRSWIERAFIVWLQLNVRFERKQFKPPLNSEAKKKIFFLIP